MNYKYYYIHNQHGRKYVKTNKHHCQVIILPHDGSTPQIFDNDMPYDNNNGELFTPTVENVYFNAFTEANNLLNPKILKQ